MRLWPGWEAKFRKVQIREIHLKIRKYIIDLLKGTIIVLKIYNVSLTCEEKDTEEEIE